MAGNVHALDQGFSYPVGMIQAEPRFASMNGRKGE